MAEEPTETLSKEEYSSEKLSLIVEKKPDCLIEYAVQTGSALSEKAYKTSVKKIAKEVTIPGFRKGKAPEELIRKKYGPQLDQQWQKDLADLAFTECQSLTKIPLLGSDSSVTFKMNSHSHEKAEMTFSFETEPTVPSVDYHKIKLKRPAAEEVTEEKVNDTIRQIQLFDASWEKILDRPAEEGDYVIIDMTVTEEDPPKPVFTNTRVEVNPKKMAKWMYDLVIDQTVGKSLEGFSRPDEDATEEEKKEIKPKKVMVTIKAIERAKLPELSDAFAQKFGAQTLDEMKTKLKQLLEKQIHDDQQRKLREELSFKLLEACHFDLPKSLVNKETAYRFRSLLQNQSFLQDWKNKSEEEKKHEQEKVSEEAEKAVRLFYISKKIVSDANVKIQEEDLHPKISSPLEAMFTDPSLVQFDQKSEEEKALTLSRIMLTKAENYLIEQMEKEHLIANST